MRKMRQRLVFKRGGTHRALPPVRARGFKGQLLRLREARRLADRDAQLLANRIALLEAEEAKAVEKVEVHRRKSQSRYGAPTHKQIGCYARKTRHQARPACCLARCYWRMSPSEW